MNSWISFFCILILGFNWSVGYLIAANCIRGGVHFTSYIFWQVFGAFVLAAIFHLIKKIPIAINSHTVGFFIFTALFGVAIPSLITYYAIFYMHSVILTACSNISPIFTYLFAMLFCLERFKMQKVFFILIGLFGVLLIIFMVNYQDIFIYINHATQQKAYLLALIFLIPISYATVAVYIEKSSKKSQIAKLNYVTKVCGMMFVASICFFPIAYYSGGLYSLSIYDKATYLLMLEIILSSISTWLIFYIISNNGVVYYTMVNAVTVLFGLLYGYLIYNQIYDSITYLAIIFIILSLFGIHYSKKNDIKNRC